MPTVTDNPLPPHGQDTPPADTPTADTPADTGEWVTLRQAAAAVDRSVSAIRKRYQAGDIEKRYDDDGRVLLNLEELRRLYADPPTPTPSTRSSVPGSDLVPVSVIETILELGREITDLTARAQVAEREATFQAERRQAAEERAKALEAEIAALRGQSTPATTTPSTPPTSSTDTPGDRSRSWWRRLRSGR